MRAYICLLEADDEGEAFPIPRLGSQPISVWSSGPGVIGVSARTNQASFPATHQNVDVAIPHRVIREASADVRREAMEKYPYALSLDLLQLCDFQTAMETCHFPHLGRSPHV